VGGRGACDCVQSGVYELRDEFLREVDLYYPRLASEDLQRTEEGYIARAKVSVATARPRAHSPPARPRRRRRPMRAARWACYRLRASCRR
jgi:hypothetical protein